MCRLVVEKSVAKTRSFCCFSHLAKYNVNLCCSNHNFLLFESDSQIAAIECTHVQSSPAKVSKYMSMSRGTTVLVTLSTPDHRSDAPGNWYSNNYS